MTTDKNEAIKLAKKMERIGETRIMNNGMMATIVVYRKANDIDIQFEDETIVKHKQYQHFQNGSISNPNYKLRIGETRIMNNGQKATIINYPNCMDIDIQFEDGTILKHKTYQCFQNGAISNPNYKPYSHLGETRIMNNGMKATIEIYRNASDMDVLFEDGTVVEHKRYDAFQKGYISNLNYKPYSCLGESRIMNNGMKATIINYPNCMDIDVQFEDGIVVKNKTCQAFKAGNIAHPNLSGNPKIISIFHNFEVKFVARTKDTAFYKCKCLSCNIEEIMTPQKMIQHEKEEIEKQNTIIEVEEEIEL